jgi:hypothetical protein
MVEMWKQHSVAVLQHFHKTLDSRPRTLTHGDMRSDNLFQRKDKSGYKVIDWQTYGASSPAVEMHQLLGASMSRLEDYAQLPSILRAYLSELHSLCPASTSYTYEMLWEDFRMVGAMLQIAFASILAGIIAELPVEAPNMELFRVALPRYAKVYGMLDIAGLTMDAVNELGLSAVAAHPSGPSGGGGEQQQQQRIAPPSASEEHVTAPSAVEDRRKFVVMVQPSALVATRIMVRVEAGSLEELVEILRQKAHIPDEKKAALQLAVAVTGTSEPAVVFSFDQVPLKAKLYIQELVTERAD